MEALRERDLLEPLLAYLRSGRPFMGICIGMQVLFQGSDENPGVPGLGIFPARVTKFRSDDKTVPHMGWNAATMVPLSTATTTTATGTHGQEVAAWLNHRQVTTSYYFVHSYAVRFEPGVQGAFAYGLTRYGEETFVSAIRYGNIFATQFHPEKSGADGLAVLGAFLQHATDQALALPVPVQTLANANVPVVPDRFTKRIIACLDVRANDSGDLVVTKGDQYDVRERNGDGTGDAQVRNLGKPVDLARRYYHEGADEVTFLNITSFRNCPLGDLPMLEVLRRTSETVFVPLTIGGGIRSFVEETTGKKYSALEVADAYFRSGADKVSIGSDAVYAAEEYYRRLAAGEKPLRGDTAIEAIATKYGSQAVVISVDPKRILVADRSAITEASHHVVEFMPGQWCWYQCTVKGGRERRDLDVRQLVQACEAMGAGEILLNSMDQDGTNSGYDLALVRDVKQAVRIPVIASSGAGCVEHFSQVFRETGVESALAAGIFHRKEVPIASVKQHLKEHDIRVREGDLV